MLADDGLYRQDTVLAAAGNTAVDAFVLASGISLLVTARLQHRRGARGYCG